MENIKFVWKTNKVKYLYLIKILYITFANKISYKIQTILNCKRIFELKSYKKYLLKSI